MCTDGGVLMVKEEEKNCTVPTFICSFFLNYFLVEGLRCPIVTKYTPVCSERTEHFCESDKECLVEGQRCCPSRQRACQLACTKAEILSKY